MPVVEKINITKIPQNTYPAEVNIYNKTCHILDDRNIMFGETVSNDGTLIECVYNTVVKFITWYNY